MKNTNTFQNGPEMKATARLMLKLRKQREEREAALSVTPAIGQTTVTEYWNGTAWVERILVWDGCGFRGEA
jgi:hypothetical protein